MHILPARLSRPGFASSIPPSLRPGKRISGFQMLNQSDAVPIQARHRFTNDGRFRLLVFPGDLSQG